MITLPIYAILLICLSFWLLLGSRVHWALRSSAVVGMVVLALITWYSVPSFFGWGATPDNLYDKPLTIYYSVIEEPNAVSPGGIYFVVSEPRTTYENFILRVFGFPVQARKPRLHRFPYSRNLHEQVIKDMVPSFERGQPVQGEFGKGKKGEGEFGKDGTGKPGEGDAEGDGEPDESQDDGETHFHRLQPSEIQPKAVPKPKKDPASLAWIDEENNYDRISLEPSRGKRDYSQEA